MRFQPGELNIFCTDLRRTLRFYHDVLGFEVVAEDNGAVRLRAEAQWILLLPFAQERAAAAPYGRTATFSLDLMVDDIEAAYAYLSGMGVDFAAPWQPGTRRFFLYDPDGLVLEVIERQRP